MTPTEHLSTYLHDHASGADGALERIDTLISAHSGTSVAEYLKKLKEEILWERTHLEFLCSELPLKSGVPRRAAAWVAEKGLELKLALDGEKEFRLFESLEALSVGIAGKRLLWRVLRQEAKSNPLLRGLPYRKLINMAVRQRRAVEVFRLEVANSAFRASVAQVVNQDTSAGVSQGV